MPIPLRRLALRSVGVCAGAFATTTGFSVRTESHTTSAQSLSQGGGSGKPMLFLSDLDGTLHGFSVDAQHALRRWTAFWDETEAPSGSVLCYNTGRCITDYVKVLQPELPVPDVLITGDGTEIRWLRKGLRATLAHGSTGALDGDVLELFYLDEEWAAAVEGCWHSARDRVVAAMECDNEGHLADLNVVSNSPPRGESRWAITVRGEEKAQSLCAAYTERFRAEGVCFYAMAGWGEPRCHLIVALPASCGKLNAARHVQKRTGFASAACVSAGDSENDLPMIRSGFGFIVVANAVANLVQAVDGMARPDLHYRAAAPFASGVVEGLQHFRRRMETAHDSGARPDETGGAPR